MADFGGKKFVEDFKSTLQAQIAKAFEDGRQMIQEATTELTTEIRQQSRGAAAAIRAEAKGIKDSFAPTLGNNPDGGDEVDPTKKTEGEGG